MEDDTAGSPMGGLKWSRKSIYRVIEEKTGVRFFQFSERFDTLGPDCNLQGLSNNLFKFSFNSLISYGFAITPQKPNSL
ncbi:hypothetical protein ES705_27071 [subsurface metagenome]